MTEAERRRWRRRGERIPEGKYGETERETDGRRRKNKEEVKHSWREMRKEERGNGEMKGLFFTVCFWTVFITLQPVLSLTHKHSSSPSLPVVYSSVSPFGFLRQSFAVFICLSVIFRFCLFSAAVLSAHCRLCEECVNDVTLNIGCVLSTPSHICVCEQETPRERERARCETTLSGCF